MRSVNWICALLVCCWAALGLRAQSSVKAVTCASCHTAQASTQPATSMGRALLVPSTDPLFQTHPKLTAEKGPYSYTLEMRDGKVTYTVSNGQESIDAPVQWIFGVNAQTYVLERNGQFYESMVSYFPGAGGLDTTIGDQVLQPKSVEEAFGRPLGSAEITQCFGCHSTGAVSAHKLHIEQLTPGLTCAHCHTGSEEHSKAIAHGSLAAVPAKLKQQSPEEFSEFCGQCHRTWETVVRNGWLGKINVRFQPYRLASSKCFDGVDPRLSCIACHDPHQEVVRETAAYDAKCLSCHSTSAKVSTGMLAAHPGATAMKTCPVSSKNCVSCHMPKVELEGAHRAFTDHDIRIARDGSYPE